MIEIILTGVGSMILLFLLFGIRIIRPTEEALHERFGKYIGKKSQGFNWIIPIVDRLIVVNMTENMVDIPEQFVITKDDLNAKVDGVVYFRVQDPIKAIYKAENYKIQITSLARTTLRDIFGKMTLSDSNSKRNEINAQLEIELDKQTDAWGIEIVRVELQEIQPPNEVVKAMNEVVVAERKKIAAKDFANALEIEADGKRRASIKEADGKRQAQILEAEGQAKAFHLVNESFKDNAVILKQLEVTAQSLQNGTKYVIDPHSKITNVISEMSGIVPISKKD